MKHSYSLLFVPITVLLTSAWSFGPLVPDGKIDQEALVAWNDCRQQIDEKHGIFVSNRPFRECMKEKGYQLIEN